MTTKTKYELKVENQTLLIKHPLSDGNELFDVCDASGKIHISGKLSQDKVKTRTCLKSINKGSYSVYIINEGSVFQENLTV